jgi:hypothetical protein
MVGTIMVLRGCLQELKLLYRTAYTPQEIST